MKNLFILINLLGKNSVTYKKYQKELKNKFIEFYKEEVNLSNDYEDEDNDIFLFDLDSIKEANKENEDFNIEEFYNDYKKEASQYYEEFYVSYNGAIYNTETINKELEKITEEKQEEEERLKQEEEVDNAERDERVKSVMTDIEDFVTLAQNKIRITQIGDNSSSKNGYVNADSVLDDAFIKLVNLQDADYIFTNIIPKIEKEKEVKTPSIFEVKILRHALENPSANGTPKTYTEEDWKKVDNLFFKIYSFKENEYFNSYEELLEAQKIINRRCEYLKDKYGMYKTQSTQNKYSSFIKYSNLNEDEIDKINRLFDWAINDNSEVAFSMCNAIFCSTFALNGHPKDLNNKRSNFGTLLTNFLKTIK